MVQAGNERLLSGINYAALVMDGFEARELLEPWHALEEAGATLRIISATKQKVQGLEHNQPADQVEVHLIFDEADPQEFAGVLLPGGAAHVEQLRKHAAVKAFLQGMAQDEKPIAALGQGVAVLTDAGLVKGHRVTGDPDLQATITEAGGRWTEQNVVTDGFLVSGRRLEDLPDFIDATLALMESRVRESVQGTRDENADIGPSS